MRNARINWSIQEYSWPFEEELRNEWLIRISGEHGKQLRRLNVNLLTDEELIELNRDHLDHDTYTDIITFDYSSNKGLEGEIFISYDRVEENAAKENVANNQELMRVIAHGLLHLCGLKDKLESEKLEMREAEENALKLWLEVSRGT